MPDHARENALLLACSRAAPPSAALEQVRRLASSVDWERVITSADSHIVWPLVFANLIRAGVRIPDAFAWRWRDLPALLMRDNLARLSQLDQLFELFDTHGIPCVTWKGPVFTATGYGSLTVRACCDLDLLIPFEHRRVVQRLMVEHGYTYRPHALQRLMPRVWNEFVFVPAVADKAVIEIHPSIALWCAMAQPSTSDLIARARSVTIAGRTIRTLGGEDMLLAIALHGAFHWWMRLRLVADVDAAAQDVGDWDVVIERAGRVGILRLVRVALLLARQLLNTSVPQRILDDAARDRVAVWLTARLVGNLSRPTEPPSYPGDVLALLSHDRLSHRLVHTLRLFVWRELLTRAERIAVSAERALQQAPPLSR